MAPAMVSADAFDAAPATAGGAEPPKPPPTAHDAEQQIGARAINAALPVFAKWSDDIARAASKAATAADAETALAAWAAKAANDEAVQRSIYETTMLASMCGQLQVRDVEAPSALALSRTVALAADGSLPEPEGGGPIFGFASLPFDEAVRAFLARSIVSPEQWQAMDADARQRSFAAAGLASGALQDEAYRGILSALDEGSTLREFAAQIRSGERTLGVSESDPSYLETLFRTTISVSYAAGRHEQMASPEVMESHPIVEFRAIVDGRTTSQCRFCNGLQFDRVNDPGWVKFSPPLHFNCRSTTALLRRSQTNPSRLINSADVDPRGDPAPGFGGAPSLTLDAE